MVAGNGIPGGQSAMSSRDQANAGGGHSKLPPRSALISVRKEVRYLRAIETKRKEADNSEASVKTMGKGKGYLSEEDIALCRAWIRVSEDPVTGTE